MAEKKRILIITGVALAVYISMKYLFPYVIPFLIAWILVRALNPILRKIRSWLPWKKEVLISILVFLVFLLGGILVYYLYKAVMEQLYGVISNFDRYYYQMGLFLDECCISLEKKTGVKAVRMRSMIDQGLESAEIQINGKLIPGILNHSLQYILGLIQIIGCVFIIYIAMILLMKDYDRIKEDLSKYELYHRVCRVTDRVFRVLGAYVRSQCTIISVVTILCIGGLYLLGNPYALLLGLIIGLLDALPFLGTGTILLPWAFVLLIQKEITLAAGYAVLFLVTYVVREFLEPKLVGKRLGIYPFIFALAVYAGICFFGPAGIFAGPIGIILTIEISKEFILVGKV